MNETLTGAQLMGITTAVMPPTQSLTMASPQPVTDEQPATVIMIDATHTHVHNIPPSTPKVAGYDTGSPDIDWTEADRALFPRAGHVMIDQSLDLLMYNIGDANVADVETGAATIPAFVDATVHRIAHGEQGWIYGSGATIAYAAERLTRAGVDLGKVGAWLADWNLNEQEAITRLGTTISGIRIVAVQWASPSSNPATIVPGGTQTLAEAQVDLSVTEAGWFAAPVQKAPPPVVPPTHAEAIGALTTLAGYFGFGLQSLGEA